MRPTLVAPKVPPGMWRNGTKYQSKGRWYDGNLVRFRAPNIIQPWGGWQETLLATGLPVTVSGVPRAMLGWMGNDDVGVLGIGTNSKLYALKLGVLTDITPAGFVPGGVDTGYNDGADPNIGQYGNGLYGAGPYGSADPLLLGVVPATSWQLDNFGEYLVGCAYPSDGELYVWDNDIAGPAIAMAGAPTNNRGIVVTPERFVLALGAGGEGRRVEWASQESLTDWTPTDTNTAGGYTLDGTGVIVTGRRGEGETLIWTTSDLYAARYIGGAFIYTFRHLGTHCGDISPGAVAMLGGRAVWMSGGHFRLYDGAVREIPCDVLDGVFGDFNVGQQWKVIATTQDRWNEVTWFYPSAGSSENDRYVTWNHAENHWSLGSLARTGAVDSGALQYPVMAQPDGVLFDHDRGQTRTDLNGEIVMPFVESGPVELGDGDEIMHVSGLVPDEKVLGTVTYKLYGSMAPGEDETERGTYSTGSELDLRFSARAVRVRLEEGNVQDWRAGFPRWLITSAGRRGPGRARILSGLHDGRSDHGGTYYYL